MEWSSEIEAVVREDPDDEARWSVLEDWTLERGDLRAKILELDKARDRDGAQHALWQFQRELFGKQFDHFYGGIGASTWRAGYLLDCHLKIPASKRAAMLETVLAHRIAAVMRSLLVDIDNPTELASTLSILAQAPHGTSVRQLSLHAFWKPAAQPATFDPALLAPLSITRLRFTDRAITVPYGPELARLRVLWLTPGSPQDLRGLFDTPGGLADLEELAVYVPTLEHRHGLRPELFETILDGSAAPALRRFHIRDASPELRAVMLERAATSSLLPRLEKFSFGYDAIALDDVPEHHRATFAHVAY